MSDVSISRCIGLYMVLCPKSCNVIMTYKPRHPHHARYAYRSPPRTPGYESSDPQDVQPRHVPLPPTPSHQSRRTAHRFSNGYIPSYAGEHRGRESRHNRPSAADNHLRTVRNPVSSNRNTRWKTNDGGSTPNHHSKQSQRSRACPSRFDSHQRNHHTCVPVLGTNSTTIPAFSSEKIIWRPLDKRRWRAQVCSECPYQTARFSDLSKPAFCFEDQVHGRFGTGVKGTYASGHTESQVRAYPWEDTQYCFFTRGLEREALYRGYEILRDY